MSSAGHWTEALQAWAIPQHILDGAPGSPWGYDPRLFVARAEAAQHEQTPSQRRALEALPEGGTVLDVGCGGGAASLPLAAHAGKLIGVDSSADMLSAFARASRNAGVDVETVQGRWPDVAGQTPIADVIVCHHVAYNAADLASFVQALTAHARRRVVMELTNVHPMSRLNALWLRLHGLVRPSTPTADDAMSVIRETGVEPQREECEGRTLTWEAGFTTLETLSAETRRRLCLPREREAEVTEALRPMLLERDGLFSLPMLPLVTLWWPGGAPR